MNCAWNALLSILPQDMRLDVDRQVRDTLQEIRFRLGQAVELVCHKESKFLSRKVCADDLSFVINTASRYSPWSARTIAQGFITAPGGHRIGISGECIMQNGQITGMSHPSSLCVRVSRDFPGIGQGCELRGSVLILGPPGSGKTTLLRDLIRRRSNECTDYITVVDERGELFPNEAQFSRGLRTDVITGCSKASGVEIALRTMGPSVIAVDEITAREDCDALRHAAWCGVDLMATAHAFNRGDLKRREIYRPLAETKLFRTMIVLNRDKTWYMERIDECT